MARSKATARKPKAGNEIKGGRVKKLEQDTAKDKMALKVAAKRTPSSLQEQKQEKKKLTPRPISKVNKHRNKDAREALASGELAAEDSQRRKDRDIRTLYVRFKDKENLPENREAIEKLHTDIQSVRIPRQAEKRLTYAFIEFSSETKCENAKASIEKGGQVYVDYVGLKSKGGGKAKDERGGKGKISTPINPTRLFIDGLIEGMTEDKLKQLFPKCSYATIPKGSIRKGTPYGFVQFSSPADAKAAFDAAQKLSKGDSNGQHITVLYAKATNHPLNVQSEGQAERDIEKARKRKQDWAEKRKAAKRPKQGNESHDNEMVKSSAQQPKPDDSSTKVNSNIGLNVSIDRKEETKCTDGDNKESDKGDSKPEMKDDYSDNEESTDNGEDIENDEESEEEGEGKEAPTKYTELNKEGKGQDMLSKTDDSENEEDESEDDEELKNDEESEDEEVKENSAESEDEEEESIPSKNSDNENEDEDSDEDKSEEED